VLPTSGSPQAISNHEFWPGSVFGSPETVLRILADSAEFW